MSGTTRWSHQCDHSQKWAALAEKMAADWSPARIVKTTEEILTTTVLLGMTRTGSAPWLDVWMTGWKFTGDFWGSELGGLVRSVLPRVVTTVIVGAGVMMIGEVGVAALSTRGRVFGAMTGATELYGVTNTYAVVNVFTFSFYRLGMKARFHNWRIFFLK